MGLRYSAAAGCPPSLSPFHGARARRPPAAGILPAGRTARSRYRQPAWLQHLSCYAPDTRPWSRLAVTFLAGYPLTWSTALLATPS